ncbi:LuxR C-terminal-related transcriptional regulator [Actinosynnema sp. NPDC047251]|uniref:Transcriptional regulator n=1 Tax=Saccharothrix espanaensis (strain ATCC 51144 / DSM 44229 / JCM 9112 / NBRC 15066 / NRRL 15764) TaxID=1179773 RepID=K0K2E3_SACES|nr:LuxR C-terminal-related transcriptional regulator [Saccharothrix espanaensis]CCH31029.1 Transcriptional regulator [Saccharothrix espanaensis DSM 44229]
MTTGEQVGVRAVADQVAGRGADRVADRVADLPEPGGGPRRVRVVGGTGAGKSRLLGEFARRARLGGVPVLAARGTDTGRMVPFGALRDSLRPPADGPTPAARTALLLLRAVFHSFLGPGRGRSALPSAERHRLYRTVGDLVASVGRPAGLLVLLDDAHLADAGSLELLGHLLRHPPGVRLSVVAAHVPDACPAAFGDAEEIGLAPVAPDTTTIAPGDLRVAQAVAVLGDAEPRLVAAVAGTTLHETRAALVRLASRGVLGVDGGDLGYRRERVRQSVYDGADAEWRRAAHARAAQALRDEDAPIAVRAYQVARAARVGDRAAVAELVRAADAAAGVAPAIAAHWLVEALRLTPRTDDPDRLRLLRRLAAAARAAGRPDEHLAAVRAVLAARPADRAEIALRGALAQRACGRHSAAGDLLRRLLHDPGGRRGRLLGELGLAADRSVPARRADEVLAAAREVGDDAVLSLALGVRLGKPPYHPALLDEAAALADRLADCPLESLLWLGRAETTLERLPAAVGHLDRAIRAARTTDRDDLLPHLWLARGEALERLGRLVEAQECFTDAAEAAALAGTSACLPLAGLARIAVWRGEADEGLRLAERAVTEGVESRAHVALALAHLHADDPDRCAAHLLAVDVPPADPLAAVEWCSLVALAEGARHRVPDAARWAERAGDLARRLPADLRRGYAHLAQVGALRRTDPEAAAGEATLAAESFERIGNRVHAGRARLMASALHHVAGSPRQARAERDRARDLLDGCEAGLFERVAGSWAPIAEHGLTDRERSVLAVLAQGLTAEAIARRMDISPRTVHRHLQHLYRKLGTADRLATVLRAQSLGLLDDAPSPVGC